MLNSIEPASEAATCAVAWSVSVYSRRSGNARIGSRQQVWQKLVTVAGADPSIQGKAERALADEIGRIVSHQVFREWLKDPTLPKHFRDAGHFWEIAPGTPPSVIRTRIARVDNTLKIARSLLEEKGVEGIAARHGKALFDRPDIY